MKGGRYERRVVRAQQFLKSNIHNEVGPCYDKSFVQNKLNLTTLLLSVKILFYDKSFHYVGCW